MCSRMWRIVIVGVALLIFGVSTHAADQKATGETDCPEMAVVPAGRFTMGPPERKMRQERDEVPQHEITGPSPGYPLACDWQQESEFTFKGLFHVPSFRFSELNSAIAAAGAISEDARIDGICAERPHAGLVSSAAFSPDGQRIVTASWDGTARICDVKTGTILRRLAGHGQLINSAVFSPDGKRIVTASVDGRARIWDADTGAELRRLIGYSRWINSAVFSPDGKRIATASWDGTVQVWDANTGAELRRFTVHGQRLSSAGFSPDGQRIIAALWDGTAGIWDANTGAELRRLTAGHTQRVNSAVFSSDSQHIATASSDGTAQIWDANTGAKLRRLIGHRQWINSVAFSPNGHRIVTASGDGTARIWDTDTSAELHSLIGGGEIRSAAFSPDGQRIVTASSDGTVQVWKAETGTPLSVIEGDRKEAERTEAREDVSASISEEPEPAVQAAPQVPAYDSLFLWGLGLFLGPVIFALISLGKSAVTSRRMNALNEIVDGFRRKIDDVSGRLDKIEQKLKYLALEKAPVARVSEEDFVAPVDVSAYETPLPEIGKPEAASVPQPVAKEMPYAELRQEAERTKEREDVSASFSEEPEPAVQAAPQVPAIEQPSLAKSAITRVRSLEEKVAANWLVWVGGVAVALAGGFLVRYAAEQGWLSPTTRCIAGIVLGAALVVVGETIRRRPLERAIAAIKPDYVPQALTAAGLFTAFASIYLAHAFYGLLPATLTFLLLGAIALVGLGLALLQGQFLAALGLVGAMATPALVSTDNPSPWGLFSYLGVIAAAAMVVSDRRGWWWLSLAAIVASFLWTLIWFAQLFSTPDIVPIATVSAVIAGAALWLASRALPKNGGEPGRDRFGLTADSVGWIGLAVALATVFVLAVRSEFAPAAHWTVLATAVAAAAVSRWQPRFDLALPATCILAVAAFGLNYVDGMALNNLAERAFGWPETTLYSLERYRAFVLHASLVSVVLFLGGLITINSVVRPSYVALATAAVPVLLLATGYAEFRNIAGDAIWALPAAIVTLSSAAVIVILRQKETAPPFVIGVYVTAAVAAAVLALTFLFDRLWLTIAYAALLIFLGAISIRVDLTIMRRLASLIGMLIVLRLTINPDLRGYELFYPFEMQWVSYGYLVPALAFVMAARLFRRTHDDLMVTVLEGGALLFAIMFVSIEIRIFMTGTIYSGAYKLPEMSLQTISWLTAALILCLRHTRHPRLFSLWGARLLTLAGVGQSAILQLILHNPVFTGDFIQGHGLFNILILALLAPGALIWLIAANFASFVPQREGGLPFLVIGLRVVSALLVFAFVTEEVRVFFQGTVIRPRHASLLELYSTTLVWLAIAAPPLVSRRIGALEGTRQVTTAVMVVSLLMLFVGHSFAFNPVFDGSVVRGWPIFNTLLLGFILPAAIVAVIAQSMAFSLRPWLGGAAYVLLLIGVTLIVKQAFQGGYLVLDMLSERESYAYSAAWIGLAIVTMMAGLIWVRDDLRYAALAVLILAALKVFLLDMSVLAGLWRVASFLGLGLSLIGIGWVYQRFIFNRNRKPTSGQKSETRTL